MELKIKNEDIVQLRQNDLNRGRNKSNAPVYPKTVPEAIIGLSSYLGKEGLKDVIIVSELPNTGEEGKIYYNTTNNTYYISDNGKWRTFNETTVVTNLDDVPRQPPVGGAQARNSYVLSPNVFYNIANWNRVPAGGVPSTSMVFDFKPADGIYAGRFTAWADDMNITWPADVTTPDNVNTTIVNGHTYEFNVWQGVLILVDVTSTEQGGE